MNARDNSGYPCGQPWDIMGIINDKRFIYRGLEKIKEYSGIIADSGREVLSQVLYVQFVETKKMGYSLRR